jgi:hypothetical protein
LLSGIGSKNFQLTETALGKKQQEKRLIAFNRCKESLLQSQQSMECGDFRNASTANV